MKKSNQQQNVEIAIFTLKLIGRKIRSCKFLKMLSNEYLVDKNAQRNIYHILLDHPMIETTLANKKRFFKYKK